MSEYMDGGNNQIISPFQKKKFSVDNQTSMLEKLFPIGSKGKDSKKVQMKAQPVKTLELDNEFPEVP